MTTVPESLAGQYLIAMPGMTDKRFARSVVYLCLHSSEQAMGIIINRRADNVSFSDVLQHIALEEMADIDPETPDLVDRAVHFGGPVQTTRGFVLHSPDYMAEKRTLPVQETVCLTATVDVLQAIASGRGPARSLFALGYAGWAGDNSRPRSAPMAGCSAMPTPTSSSRPISRIATSGHCSASASSLDIWSPTPDTPKAGRRWRHEAACSVRM